MQKAGMPEWANCHTLRHTFITLASQDGLPIRTLQKYIDHSSIQTTEQYYAHDVSEEIPKINLE